MTLLQVTPTGPWGKDVHPAMPISLDELLDDLGECFEAGAGGVHLHVRDESGVETFDPAVVNETCRRVRELSDAPVEIGLTTGAWIVPELADRIAMIREWEGVDLATVNLSEDGWDDVMRAMLETGIGVDAGVWSPSEMPRLVASGLLPRLTRVSIEIDPGSSEDRPEVVARQVSDLLDRAGSTCPRLTHGSGEWTWPLVRDAFRRGHDTRVGFEDSVLLPDGETAGSNADLVRAAVALN
ncbi:3-keto-5-aminohexanoate cleavage protein [Actinoplanes solisilvae]|uniref:3-keto-5-aminohexanoate cleavage protein n=1 Tax=Actinoplanes solisilvae TaxID=2486853 RepID=UPI001F0C82FE|nr:3-keto-5-aminohexanoate cleavage protein [Actinoplanes solisilvae]